MATHSDSPGYTSFVDALRKRASSQPRQPAYTFLEDGEREADQISFADLDHRARALAGALQASYSPGDRALLLFPPGLEFITGFFGCLYAGLIAVPAYLPRGAKNLSIISAIAADADHEFLGAVDNGKILVGDAAAQDLGHDGRVPAG